MTLAVTAVADEKRLPEETASVCLKYEKVWNLMKAMIANSTARNLNSTYICSRPSESEGERNPTSFDPHKYLLSDTAVDMKSARPLELKN